MTSSSERLASLEKQATKYFPWCVDASSSSIQLTRAIQCLVAQGQFETARSLFAELRSRESHEAVDNLLCSIMASSGGTDFVSSPGIPTAAHLEHMCIDELSERRRELEEGDGQRRERREFSMLVHAGVAERTDKEALTAQLLLWHDGAAPLTDHCLTVVLDSLLESEQAHSFALSLIDKFRRRPDARLRIDAELLQRLEASVGNVRMLNDESARRTLRLLSLLDLRTYANADDDAAFTARVDSLLLRLVELCEQTLEGGAAERNDWRRLVYQALLCCSSHTPLQRFCQAEQRYVTEACKRRVNYPFDMLMAVSEDGAAADESDERSAERATPHTDEQDEFRFDFWLRLLRSLLGRRDTNLMQHLLETCARLIGNDEWAQLAALLSHFAVLRPIVLLLGWDTKQSLESRCSLLDSVWRDKTRREAANRELGARFTVLCDTLEHRLRMSQWLAPHILHVLKHSDVGSIGSANASNLCARRTGDNVDDWRLSVMSRFRMVSADDRAEADDAISELLCDALADISLIALLLPWLHALPLAALLQLCEESPEHPTDDWGSLHVYALMKTVVSALDDSIANRESAAAGGDALAEVSERTRPHLEALCLLPNMFVDTLEVLFALVFVQSDTEVNVSAAEDDAVPDVDDDRGGGERARAETTEDEEAAAVDDSVHAWPHHHPGIAHRRAHLSRSSVVTDIVASQKFSLDERAVGVLLELVAHGTGMLEERAVDASLDSATGARVAALRSTVSECQWRTSLLKELRAVSADVPFADTVMWTMRSDTAAHRHVATPVLRHAYVSLMLAPPSTLATLCARAGLSERVTTLAERYADGRLTLRAPGDAGADLVNETERGRLGEVVSVARHVAMVRDIERVCHAATTEDRDVPSPTEAPFTAIQQALSSMTASLSAEQAARVALDVALRVDSARASVLCLTFASQRLQAARRDEHEASVTARLDAIDDECQRLRSVAQQCVDESLVSLREALFSDVHLRDGGAADESIGTESAGTSHGGVGDKAQERGANEAIALLNAALLRSGKMAPKTADARPALRRALKAMPRETRVAPPSDEEAMNVPHPYLSVVLRHLLFLGDQLRDEERTTTRDYFYLLKLSPQQIIERLLFEHDERATDDADRNARRVAAFEKAEVISERLNLDVARIALRRLGVNRETAIERMALAAHDTGAAGEDGWAVALATREGADAYQLDDALVRHIGSKRSLLVPLMCALRSPVDSIDASRLQWALRSAEEHAVLQRWLECRVDALLDYAHIMLHSESAARRQDETVASRASHFATCVAAPPPNTDALHAYELVTRDDDVDDRYWLRLCDALIDANRPLEAVQLADQHCLARVPDRFLLAAIAWYEESSDEERLYELVWPLVRRLDDIDRQAALVDRLRTRWSLEVAIDAVALVAERLAVRESSRDSSDEQRDSDNSSAAEAEEAADSVSTRLESAHFDRHRRLMQCIVHIVECTEVSEQYTSWREIERSCADEVARDRLFERLVDAFEFDVARSLARCVDVLNDSHILLLIEGGTLRHALQRDDEVAAIDHLCSLDTDRAIRVASLLLGELERACSNAFDRWTAMHVEDSASPRSKSSIAPIETPLRGVVSPRTGVWRSAKDDDEALSDDVVRLMRSQIFLIDFILRDVTIRRVEADAADDVVERVDVDADARHAWLGRKRLGLRLLLALPPVLARRHASLHAMPLLIIENLLMSAHSQALSDAALAVPELMAHKRVRTLVLRYARRAMSYDRERGTHTMAGVHTSSRASEASSTQLVNSQLVFIDDYDADVATEVRIERTEWWVNGVEAHDNRQRASHFFVHAPDWQLFAKLLSIVPANEEAARCCLVTVEALGRAMSTLDSTMAAGAEGHKLIGAMRKVVQHGKTLFASPPMSASADDTSLVCLESRFDELIAALSEAAGERRGVHRSEAAVAAALSAASNTVEVASNEAAVAANEEAERDAEAVRRYESLSESAGLEVCDTLLGHVELLQQLRRTNIRRVSSSDTDVSLEDLRNAAKARQLRDRLIADDEMELALEVSTKCGIEPAPVWISWGLHLLAAKRYDEARHKFHYCLVPNAEMSEDASRRARLGAFRRSRPQLASSHPDEPASPAHSSSSSLPSVDEVRHMSGDDGVSQSGSLDDSARRMMSAPSPVTDNVRRMGATAAVGDTSNKVLSRILSTLERASVPSSGQMRDWYQRLASQQRSRGGTQYYDEMSKSSFLRVMHMPSGSPASSSSDASKRKQKRRGSKAKSAATVAGVAVEAEAPDTDERLQECLYYLSKYGSAAQTLRFMVRHNLMSEAGAFVVEGAETRVPPTLFVTELVVPCLARLRLTKLLEAIRERDNRFTRTRRLLYAACKYFGQQHAYEVLLDVQLFMGDTVRAGLTCIKIFLSLADVAATPDGHEKRVQWLQRAEKHLNKGQHELQSRRVHGGGSDTHMEESVLSVSDLTKYARSVRVQTEISRFFWSKRKQVSPGYLSMSLFGAAKQKSEIAEQLLVLGSFDLAFPVMQDFRLPHAQIYANTIHRLASRHLTGRVHDLLRDVRMISTDEEWDGVCLSAVRVYAESGAMTDVKAAEKFAQQLQLPASVVEANILLGKLKAAYLQAARVNDIDLVRRVAAAAEARNDESAAQLCRRYLHQVAAVDSTNSELTSGGGELIDATMSGFINVPSQRGIGAPMEDDDVQTSASRSSPSTRRQW